ncbi:hypothetical protein SLEP1_g10222 [Rubroshorea leprosula]|uniref:Protein kinase domain-containing protein n=1 Tax=Rubroshorea leprosula TaxID=152421 RepID=A0AAV5IHC2_9ROSI|nr:hypothetical protein SLEP1_g10222 [Rubroshorea leprosula]
MKGSFHPTTHLIKIFIFITVSIGKLVPCPVRSAVAEDDIKCLRGVQASLNISSWDFSDSSVGICFQFIGVQCGPHDGEKQLYALQLPDMQLSGEVPNSLQYCGSLQYLNLSTNNISGTIPADLCSWMPKLITLDLSNNDLSGEIPPDLANCALLSELILSNNRLSGTIPYKLSSLVWLKNFSVANNSLRGAVPPLFFNRCDKAGFEGNDGLCGGPLGECSGSSKKSLAIIIAAGMSGAAASSLLSFGVWWFYHPRRMKRPRGGFRIGRGDDSSWVERLRAHKLTQVSLFQKPLVKVKLADLMTATNNFHAENIIISTRTGTTYKAMLPDGSALAIKRLNSCILGEKQFRLEMNRLGQLRHPNLAPLLGFCLVEDEKLLVYKNMRNGTLYSLLHRSDKILDWPTRFSIGLGVARGVAWLHHGTQPPLIHQNICSNLILVDQNFDARIMDVGLARLMTSSDESTYVNGELGEFGSIALEYSSSMVPSLKEDGYGVGVVLLELVTGQKLLEVETSEEGFKGNLVDWVNHLSGSGRIKDSIDKAIFGKGHDEDILLFLKIAMNCVVTRPEDRWSVFQVYQSLKNPGWGTCLF